MLQTQNVKRGSIMEPRLRLQSYASPTKTFKGWRILSFHRPCQSHSIASQRRVNVFLPSQNASREVHQVGVSMGVFELTNRLGTPSA